MKNKTLEKTQQTIKRKWKIIEGKERPIVLVGLAIGYILFLSLVFVIYNSFQEKLTLEMKFESESSFNSIYIALSDSTSKALSVMEDEGVTAIGIYSSSGQVYTRLGDAPTTIPLSKLAKTRQKGQDSTLGIYLYDDDTKEIEYFRLSRLNVALETGSFSITQNNSSKTTFDFPEIIYVRFDGSSYYASLRNVRFLTLVCIVALTAIFLLVLNMYLSNRRYRVELHKNQGLAKLGAAARTLTHEIKNPLSAMTIQSALLKKLLPEEYHDDLKVMDSEIQRLTNLTNRVSEFLKNPVGNPVDIELISYITNIASLFAMPIEVDSGDLEKVYVSFDADRARSVFENLIKNATESTTDHDPQVSVEIRKGRKDSVVVKVLDRGDGLAKDSKDKIFDPFYTTKINGSGIGLSISREFVTAVGGTLKLYDRDGGGTVAEVVLPCSKEATFK
jgi:two-component system, NtrC family, sensor histidine kinase HydH